MTYKVYIRNDYKQVGRRDARRHALVSRRHWLYACSASVLCLLLLSFMLLDVDDSSSATQGHVTDVVTVARDHEVKSTNTAEHSPAVAPPQALQEIQLSLPALLDLPESQDWHELIINKGDNLSLLFARLDFSPSDLHKIITLNKDTRRLKNIMPGQKLFYTRVHGQLDKLKYEADMTTSLIVSRAGEHFTSELIKTELSTRIKHANGIIHDSLFLAGQDAGLSDNMIIKLAAIYGWDIDFVLDIRKGDSFKLIYEEKYKDEKKVSEGAILVAEFINRNKRIRAVRYHNKAGQFDYYTDEGVNMRKTFLRNPLNFTRISSRFSLGRKHPILNKIRAHMGVDYAAPTGTPIKATGNGTVHYVGRKGGYGKMLILHHGGNKYTTVYAHLSRYRQGLRRGQAVMQGQTIGYVGSTGLATGPHLHYEFRLNGVHRNPLTVTLPKADSIPDAEMVNFKLTTSELIAMLDSPAAYFTQSQQQPKNTQLALKEE